jgi:hypothetical protein
MRLDTSYTRQESRHAVDMLTYQGYIKVTWDGDNHWVDVIRFRWAGALEVAA